ncbi:VCBS domain-containing protein [Vibrio chagasii]|nr:VCBS domain-containing protein [Vibrio chagasii]
MTSADGTEHDITVTINGTNDAPVIGTGRTAWMRAK